MTQPTVTERDCSICGKPLLELERWANADDRRTIVHLEDIAALHAILTEKLAEMNARKWEVSPEFDHGTVARCWHVQRRDSDGAQVTFWVAGSNAIDAEKRARAYAAQQNAEEGLS